MRNLVSRLQLFWDTTQLPDASILVRDRSGIALRVDVPAPDVVKRGIHVVASVATPLAYERPKKR